MEKITTYNYEAFYLDYLEGNLSDEGKQMLFNFLNQHPDLKAELDADDDLLEFKLLTDSKSFLKYNEKENLKHCEESIICLKNVDDYIIADIEHQISDDKKQELHQFVKQHQLQQTVFTYQLTKLRPNLDEVYPNKSELKHQAKVIPLLMRITAVAALVLLLFMVINFNSSTKQIYKQRQANYQYTVPSIDDNTNNVILPINTQYKKENVANNVNPIQHNINSTAIQPQKKTVNKEGVVPNPNENDVVEQLPNVNVVLVDSSSNKQEENTPNIIKENQQNNDNVATIDEQQHSNSNIKLVDIYRPVTQIANNYTSLNVVAKKSPPDSEYQVTKFSVGKFSFERKKKR